MKPSVCRDVYGGELVYTNNKYYLCNFISLADAKKFFKHVGWPLEELTCMISGTVPIYMNVDKTIETGEFVYYEIDEIQWERPPADEDEYEF